MAKHRLFLVALIFIVSASFVLIGRSFGSKGQISSEDLFFSAEDPIQFFTVVGSCKVAATDKTLLTLKNGYPAALYTSKASALITSLISSRLSPQTAFFATTRAVFECTFPRARVKKIASLGSDASIACLEEIPSALLIGSNTGVYRYDYQTKMIAPLENFQKVNVRAMTFNEKDKQLFVGADKGVYIYEFNDKTTYKLLDLYGGKEEYDVSSEYYDEGVDNHGADSVNVTFSTCDTHSIYWASKDKDLYYYDDGKGSFAKASSVGFVASTIYHIIAQGEHCYVASDEGLYVFSITTQSWKKLKTPRVKPVFYLYYSLASNTLYAAGKGGVVGIDLHNRQYTPITSPDKIDPSLFRQLFAGEPTFSQLQSAAIQHTDTSPKKIKSWYAKAKYKALLPSVNVGVDHDWSDTYEIYTSASNNYSLRGPKDRSYGWDVTCSWDLSDFIWKDDYTQIDTRSRLMVELRNDVLDELRRIYFERQRLKLKLTLDPPEEKTKLYEECLRLQELTANLDALTGDYFSDYKEARER